MKSLAVKWRPNSFEEVCGQTFTTTILKNQLSENKVKNAYLFAGLSGTGKTTVARIFAKELNNGVGDPIEVDAASNSGVDNVRRIINSASERSLNGEYKVYIIDEAHALSSAAWQAFLKCIEEPPAHTVFIFCTTEPKKIPETILNRVMRFSFVGLANSEIFTRLSKICKSEGYSNYEETCEYVAKNCNGSMRTAISMIEKVSSYSSAFDINNSLVVLEVPSYNQMFNLLNNLLDGNETEVLRVLDEVYMSGNSIKDYIEFFMQFCLEVFRYSLFKSMDYISLPVSYESQVKKCLNFSTVDKYYIYLLNKLIDIRKSLRGINNDKCVVSAGLLSIARCDN